MKEYDLVVVGSGASLSVLEEALEAGLSCALIERTLIGGTCLTRGCIPSKILVHPADVIREAQHARRVGLDFRLERFDWPVITARMRGQIAHGQDIEHALLHEPNVDLYKGTAEFTGPDTLRVQAPDGTYGETFRGRTLGQNPWFEIVRLPASGGAIEPITRVTGTAGRRQIVGCIQRHCTQQTMLSGRRWWRVRSCF